MFRLNSLDSSLTLSFTFSLRKSYSNGSLRKCDIPSSAATVTTAKKAETYMLLCWSIRASGPSSNGVRALWTPLRPRRSSITSMAGSTV